MISNLSIKAHCIHWSHPHSKGENYSGHVYTRRRESWRHLRILPVTECGHFEGRFWLDNLSFLHCRGLSHIRRALSTPRLYVLTKLWILSLMPWIGKTWETLGGREYTLHVTGCEPLGPVAHCDGSLQQYLPTIHHTPLYPCLWEVSFPFPTEFALLCPTNYQQMSHQQTLGKCLCFRINIKEL